MRKYWKGDLVAGVTVGIVALPLALAFGVSSGVGASAGLVTAIVAGIVAALLGGSHLQVSGPTGAMVVILAPMVASHGVGVVPLLAVLSGLILVGSALMGLGRAISLIPWPVIEGFTLGIATIIFLQQIPMALGVKVTPGRSALVSTWEALSKATVSKQAFTESLVPLAITVCVVAVIVVLRLLNPSLPGALVAVALATVVVWFAQLSVPVIGVLPKGLPAPQLPAFDWALIKTLVSGSFAVAALAGIESLLSARVAAAMVRGGVYQPDRELFGQGWASVAAGLFGGMPATGAIARTAVNVRSGGRSRLSVIVHALVLVCVVYFASGLVSVVPLSALAGVLMVTSFGMCSRRNARMIMHSTKSDAFVFIVTAVVTIALDLIQAIVVGVSVAGVLILQKLSRRSGVIREDVGDVRIAVLRVDGAMFFGVADRIQTEISRTAGVQVVILRLSRVGILDATGAKALSEIVEQLHSQGVEVLIKGLRDPHQRIVENMGVMSELGKKGHFFSEKEDAIAAARKIVGPLPQSLTTASSKGTPQDTSPITQKNTPQPADEPGNAQGAKSE